MHERVTLEGERDRALSLFEEIYPRSRCVCVFVASAAPLILYYAKFEENFKLVPEEKTDGDNFSIVKRFFCVYEGLKGEVHSTYL